MRRGDVRHLSEAALFACALAAACASPHERHTLAELRTVQPDLSQVEVGDSLDQAMQGYRNFLEDAPVSELTPEAMRRLADLKLEKEYGPLGDAGLAALLAPRPAPVAEASEGERAATARHRSAAGSAESDAAFEQRATAAQPLAAASGDAALELPGGPAAAGGPLDAIALYDRILTEYPTYRHNDQVLYQKARALDELGRVDEAIEVTKQLIAQHPGSRHLDEVQFRRAEYFFTRRRWRDAESAYSAITRKGGGSEYYEPALYKLGWSLYKQDLLDEALDEYVRLLDHKVAAGYDFEVEHNEDSERRVADTFRVISLSFSNLGGSDSVSAYFAAKGERGYEDRIYSHLGEFYFEKLRYADAAKAYKAFVALHPHYRAAPRFGMRVVEIYEAGSFPKLVLEAKKEFAASYGLSAEYWRHFEAAAAPEVLRYLKTNLADLASHYHALFQAKDLAAERTANYEEALRWYRAYLDSFGKESSSAGVNNRLADLLLEHRDFAEAASEYERTAYAYPEHERAAAAGYAAIYAHRENQKLAQGEAQLAVKRAAVESTLRFAGAFPQHEQAAVVLGAAVVDLYDMKEYAQAIATGRQLIERYPQAEASILRQAWTAVAHSAFELSIYTEAERAYASVLEMTPPDDASRAALDDNLAAAIYKQGEQANSAGDARAAADHFLRIAQAAPNSGIRPAAEYDAAAALIRLEDWAGAAEVLEAFRENHPGHELARDATQQLAFVQQKAGNLSRAAAEYERVAAEADQPERRREALLVAGQLYEDARLPERALATYLAYASEFPEPLEPAVETRFKIAGLYEAAHDEAARHAELAKIVEIERAAGGARTPRMRSLAARSALVLAERLYRQFGEVALTQPLEANLQEKQQRMDAALTAASALVDYEVAEVTAAATFYMAEIYQDFSLALIGSERPAGLGVDELRDYDLALEQEARPFAEKALQVHEKNLELMRGGIANAWTEMSLAKLAVSMPARYAKPEASSGFLESIDSYAYQVPSPPAPETPVAVTTEPAPSEAAPPAAMPEDAIPLAEQAEPHAPEAPEAVETAESAEEVNDGPRH